MPLGLQVRNSSLLDFPLQLGIDVDDVVIGKERSTEQDREARIRGQGLVDPEPDTGREVEGPDVEVQLHVSSHARLPLGDAFDIHLAGLEVEEFFEL